MIEMLRQNADKFWKRVAKHDDSECWSWMTALDRSGYGKFQFRHNGQKRHLKAHRVSYMLSNNCQIDASEFVCHTCDNPKCVNPIHLVLKDNNWNMADCAKKGRFVKGSRHGRAKLTEDQVLEIRKRVVLGEAKIALAREFDVANSTIVYVVGKGWRRGWKHV